MTGYENFNAPAFNEAAKLLRDAGWGVFNPVENDAEKGVELLGTDGDVAKLEGFDFGVAMATDCAQVCISDAIFLLPGWEKSKGANIEVDLAYKLDIPIYELETGKSVGWVLPPSPGVLVKPVTGTTIPGDSAERKALPVVSGVIDYFPAALAEVAKVSKFGNDKHNPGESLHWARGKSMDHADAIGRHLIDRGQIDPDTGMRHSAELAWRALANLQMELEAEGLAPLPRGATEA